MRKDGAPRCPWQLTLLSHAPFADSTAVSPSGADEGPPRHEGAWGAGSAARPSRTMRAHHTRLLHVARGRGGLRAVSHRHKVWQRHRASEGIAPRGVLHTGVTRDARRVGGLGPEGCRVPSHRRRGAWVARGGTPKGSARAGRGRHRRLALGGRTHLSGRLGAWHDGPEECGGHGVAAGRWPEGAARQPLRQPEPWPLRQEADEEPKADAPGQSAWPPQAPRWAGGRGLCPLEAVPQPARGHHGEPQGGETMPEALTCPQRPRVGEPQKRRGTMVKGT